jgi:hypothetical protein
MPDMSFSHGPRLFSAPRTKLSHSAWRKQSGRNPPISDIPCNAGARRLPNLSVSLQTGNPPLGQGERTKALATTSSERSLTMAKAKVANDVA